MYLFLCPSQHLAYGVRVVAICVLSGRATLRMSWLSRRVVDGSSTIDFNVLYSLRLPVKAKFQHEQPDGGI